MEFQELRKRIDEIDSELTRLFEERMDVVSSIAAYKKEHNLPIFDPQRERQKLSQLALSLIHICVKVHSQKELSIQFRFCDPFQSDTSV